VNQTINEARSAFATRPLEVAGLLLLAALTIASYGFARPAAESLFVERYGSANLPWAWLGVGVAAVATTALYNRVVTAVSLVQLWPRAVLVICAVCALLLAATALGVRHAEFALYIWKDLYIVVLVELVGPRFAIRLAAIVGANRARAARARLAAFFAATIGADEPDAAAIDAKNSVIVEKLGHRRRDYSKFDANPAGCGRIRAT